MKSLRILCAASLLALPPTAVVWAKSGGGFSSSSGSRGFSAPTVRTPSPSYTAPRQPTSPTAATPPPTPRRETPSNGFSRSATPERKEPVVPSRGFTAPKTDADKKMAPPPRPSFDSAAQRAAEIEASRKAFRESREPTAVPKQTTGTPANTPPAASAVPPTDTNTAAPPINRTEPKAPETKDRFRYSHKEMPRTTQPPSHPSGQPTVVYQNDGSISPWFWIWLMEHNNRQTRDQWVHHNRDKISETQMDEYRKRHPEIDADQKKLEADGVKRDPATKISGIEPTPRISEARDPRKSGSWFGTFMWLFLLMGFIYIVFFHRFKRSFI